MLKLYHFDCGCIGTLPDENGNSIVFYDCCMCDDYNQGIDINKHILKPELAVELSLPESIDVFVRLNKLITAGVNYKKVLHRLRTDLEILER